jgi:hypothetical protein
MNLLRDAQAHLERAKALDPGNEVANGFLERVLTSYVQNEGPSSLIDSCHSFRR